MTNKALAHQQRPGALEFNEEQRRMLHDIYAPGASDAEFSVLMEIAIARRLNPILRQVWFVQRWDSQKKRMVWAAQVSIDGLRCIAERTGQYDGQDEPEFVYLLDSGTPDVCKVRVWKKGVARPFVGVAHYEEYVQRTKEGNVNSMWGSKPHIMLAKCAEALALRKAFPEDTADLYVPEELPDAEEAPASPPSSSAPRQLHAAPQIVAEPIVEHDDAGEVLKVAMKRWRRELMAASNVEECDRVGAEIGKRLAKGSPEHKLMLTLYKGRREELQPAAQAPLINDAPPRQPGEEG